MSLLQTETKIARRHPNITETEKNHSNLRQNLLEDEDDVAEETTRSTPNHTNPTPSKNMV